MTVEGETDAEGVDGLEWLGPAYSDFWAVTSCATGKARMSHSACSY